MGTTTFTGPVRAGDVIDTTGTTAGTVKNVGDRKSTRLNSSLIPLSRMPSSA